MKSILSYTFESVAKHELYAESYSVEKKSAYNYHFIFAHGALDHHARHSRLFKSLLKSFPQSCISSFDFIGHGRSGGSRVYIDDFNHYVQDLKEFIKHNTWQVSAEKVILIGYSMGGLIAIDYLNECQDLVDKLVLINPCLKLGKQSFGGVLDKINLRDLGLFSKLKIPTMSDGTELTNDEAIIKEIMGDPLRSHKISYQLLKAIVENARRVRLEGIEHTIPTLFLLSGSDIVVDSRVNKIYAQGLKKESICIKWYDHAKHDLLNEVNRKQVYSDINDWILGKKSEKNVSPN